MQATIEYILKRFNLEYAKPPIEIPNFGRDQLADLFAELNFKVGVEIGVESGKYSEILCKANPNLSLFSVDAWKAYRGYRDHTRQEKLNGFYENTVKRLAPYPKCTVVRKFSLDAVKDFEDNSIDFVYIDGNHNFYNCTADIYHWSRKVRPGGIISGHDYARHKGKVDIHVVDVVNAYTRAYDIKPWFILGTNAEIPGEIRDPIRSWMWVKE
jgi:SAM-dependent methyltransferase